MAKWLCEAPFLLFATTCVVFGFIVAFMFWGGNTKEDNEYTGCGFLAGVFGVLALLVWALLRFVL